MQRMYLKTRLTLGTILLAIPLFLLTAASTARALESTGDLVWGNPQSTFNIDDMPAVDNSLFRPPSPPAAAYDASNGDVSVSNGEVKGNIFGGIDSASANGVSNKNIVAVDNVKIGGGVTGGWSRSGTASENKVTITNNGNSVGGLIYGGWVRGGTTAGGGADKNIVTINSGTFNNNIYGGFSQGSNGSITQNDVIIKDGTIIMNVNPSNDPHIIAGGYSSVGTNLAVSGNKVNIDGGIITNFWIYGGRGQTNTTTITDNSVTISGGTIKGGGTHNGDKGSYIYGGEGLNGSAPVQNNHVFITGGNVTATIYGGNARMGGAVTDNDITLSGGTVNGTIYGGYSVSGQATNNKVILNGGTFTGNIYGGFSGSGKDAFTDNTLKKNDATISVNEARNFQNIYFGYSGAANIGRLDTTASGSSQSGVTLFTDNNTITFSGSIYGSGDLKKEDTGTLIITGIPIQSHIATALQLKMARCSLAMAA